MKINSAHLIEIGCGLTLNTIFYFGVGYLYGHFNQTHHLKTARAFTIAALAITIFKIFVDLTMGGKEGHPKAYFAALAIGGAGLGSLEIVAMRHLELIGKTGTIALGMVVSFVTLYNFIHLHKAYKN